MGYCAKMESGKLLTFWVEKHMALALAAITDIYKTFQKMIFSAWNSAQRTPGSQVTSHSWKFSISMKLQGVKMVFNEEYWFLAVTV